MVLTCDNNTVGRLNYSGIYAFYTVPCGNVLGDESTDIQHFDVTSKLPTDSPDYRRSIVAGSDKGCLTGTKYIARTNVTGGVPANETCDKAGSMESLSYNGSYDFLSC